MNDIKQKTFLRLLFVTAYVIYGKTEIYMYISEKKKEYTVTQLNQILK